MRKIILLTVPLMVTIVFVAILLVINANRPPTWQGELDRYLQYKNSTIPGKYVLQSAVQARMPWNFSHDMSQTAFGESMHYQTDSRYGKEPPDHDTLSIVPWELPGGMLMPLPFPPEEVWCVLIERVDGLVNDYAAEGTTTFVFVALHQDLYNADYIIHETAAGLQDQILAEALANIGCER